MLLPLFFFSNGPEGTFELSIVAIGLPDDSEKDCEGNRNVTGENQPGQSLTANRNEVRYFSVIYPERLDDAGEPVAQMGRQQEEGHDVK
jgi:hypothetical protein